MGLTRLLGLRIFLRNEYDAVELGTVVLMHRHLTKKEFLWMVSIKPHLKSGA